MKKKFYIVPTEQCYNVIEAEDAIDALIGFAVGMDSDTSAYFKAVDKEPVQYPHGYKYPEGKFQVAMSIIMDTLSGDEKAPYYVKGGLDGIDLSKMNVVAELQRSYDTLNNECTVTVPGVRKRYYKLLSAITGFKFDKKEKLDPNEVMRVYLGEANKRDYDTACKALDEAGVSYDMDGAGRILITRCSKKEAFKALEKTGIYADIV